MASASSVRPSAAWSSGCSVSIAVMLRTVEATTDSPVSAQLRCWRDRPIRAFELVQDSRYADDHSLELQGFGAPAGQAQDALPMQAFVHMVAIIDDPEEPMGEVTYEYDIRLEILDPDGSPAAPPASSRVAPRRPAAGGGLPFTNILTFPVESFGIYRVKLSVAAGEGSDSAERLFVAEPKSTTGTRF